MQGVSGRIIDRLGTSAGMALSVLWWSAAAVLLMEYHWPRDFRSVILFSGRSNRDLRQEPNTTTE